MNTRRTKEEKRGTWWNRGCDVRQLDSGPINWASQNWMTARISRLIANWNSFQWIRGGPDERFSLGLWWGATEVREIWCDTEAVFILSRRRSYFICVARNKKTSGPPKRTPLSPTHYRLSCSGSLLLLHRPTVYVTKAKGTNGADKFTVP